MEQKKPNILLPLLLSLLLLAGIFLGFQLQSSVSKYSNVKTGNGTANQVLELVKAKYVDKVNLDTLKRAAADAMLNKLQLPPIYVSPARIDDTAADLRDNFQGIGIELLMMNDSMKSLILGKKAGLQHLNQD